MEEGGRLSSTGPRRERVLPVQVDARRSTSQSDSRSASCRIGACVQRAQSNDRAWSTRVVRDRSVTNLRPGRSPHCYRQPRGPALGADDRATVYGRGRGGRHRAPGDRPLRNGRCSRTGLHRKHEPGDCGLSSTARSLDRAPPAPPSQQPGRTLLSVDRQGPMDRHPDPGAAAQSPSPPRSR